MITCLVDVRVGGVVAVHNGDRFQVLRRTREGWHVELAVADWAAALRPMSPAALRCFLASAPLDAATCWARDMNTERMLRVEVRTTS